MIPGWRGHSLGPGVSQGQAAAVAGSPYSQGQPTTGLHCPTRSQYRPGTSGQHSLATQGGSQGLPSDKEEAGRWPDCLAREEVGWGGRLGSRYWAAGGVLECCHISLAGQGGKHVLAGQGEGHILAGQGGVGLLAGEGEGHLLAGKGPGYHLLAGQVEAHLLAGQDGETLWH